MRLETRLRNLEKQTEEIQSENCKCIFSCLSDEQGRLYKKKTVNGERVPYYLTKEDLKRCKKHLYDTLYTVGPIPESEYKAVNEN